MNGAKHPKDEKMVEDLCLPYAGADKGHGKNQIPLYLPLKKGDFFNKI